MPTVRATEAAAEPERLVLDTSAVLAYFADEPGAADVEQMLEDVRSGRAEVRVCFMTFMEVLYTVWHKLGENAGKEVYLRLRALPVVEVGLSEEILLAAARVKAQHHLSVADAWIAASAVATRSRLVHRDPEFRGLAPALALIELPAKERGRS